MDNKPRRIDPRRWEKFQGFRETFLLYVTDPRSSAALRGTAALLYDLVLEYYHHWPPWSESLTATEMRAALADLRFLQGYLQTVGQETESASLEESDLPLADLAARKAKDLARIGDEIEEALGGRGGGVRFDGKGSGP
jgi:type II secretory pathway component PulM